MRSPITSTSPASEFWGINQSIRYGSSTTVLSSTAGIVDTGTTLTLIATGKLKHTVMCRSISHVECSLDAFNRYRSATGAVLDNNVGLLRLTTAQFANLQSLFFTIGGKTFELTANAQIWPVSDPQASQIGSVTHLHHPYSVTSTQLLVAMLIACTSSSVISAPTLARVSTLSTV